MRLNILFPKGLDQVLFFSKRKAETLDEPINDFN